MSDTSGPLPTVQIPTADDPLSGPSIGTETAVWRKAIGNGRSRRAVTTAGGAVQYVEGLSLAELVADARSVGRPHALPLPALIEAFARLATILVRSHDRLLLHGSISPELLLIGRFGEATITGWGGTALEQNGADPAPWLAPDHKPGALPGPEDDLYALCACLSYALHLTVPTGGPPARDIPRRLRAVLVRGMSPERARRFHTADELASAIRAAAPDGFRFQMDGSLTVRPAKRIPQLAMGIAVLAALAIAGAILWQGSHPTSPPPVPALLPPVVSDSLTDTAWRQRWKPRGDPAKLEVKDGWLVNREQTTILVLDRMLRLPATIEYTGRIPVGSLPGDLSVIFGEGNLLDPGFTWPGPGGLPDGGRFFLLQNGAYDNTCNSITRICASPPSNPDPHRDVIGVGMSSVAFQVDPLEIGRTYRIRVEVQPHSVTMWRDGRLVATHEEDITLRTGTFAILLWHAGKQICDVKVWENHDPAGGDQLALGDAFLTAGSAISAADVFRSIIATGAKPASDEARLHLAIALQALGREADATAAIAEISDPIIRGKAEIRHLDQLLLDENHAAVLARVEDLWLQQPTLRKRLTSAYSRFLGKVVWSGHLREYLDLRERLFPDDDTTGWVAALYLGWHGDNKRIVEHYQRYRIPYINSLIQLGEFDLAERTGSSIPGIQTILAMQRGGFASITETGQLGILARCLMGHVDEAIAIAPADALPLLYAGRISEAASCAKPENLVALAKAWASPVSFAPLDQAGWKRLRMEVDAGKPRHNLDRCAEAVLRARMEGLPADEQAHLRSQLETCNFSYDDPGAWFPRFLVLPLLEAFDGRREALDRLLNETVLGKRDRFGQRLWYLARRIRGEISDADFLAQPAVIEAPAWMAIADAIAAELKGDAAAAAAHWKAYTNLPRHQRCLARIQGLDEVELMAFWRLSLLPEHHR